MVQITPYLYNHFFCAYFYVSVKATVFEKKSGFSGKRSTNFFDKKHVFGGFLCPSERKMIAQKIKERKVNAVVLVSSKFLNLREYPPHRCVFEIDKMQYTTIPKSKTFHTKTIKKLLHLRGKIISFPSIFTRC